MNRVSFDLSALSHSHEVLKTICSVYGIDDDTIQESDKLKVSIIFACAADFDTDDVICQIIASMQNIHVHLSEQAISEVCFILDVEIIVTDGDDTPIPGIVLPSSFISFAAELAIRVQFHLIINTSTNEGLMNSGSYLYIESNNEIDVQRLNIVAGTSPSFVYRKGCMGKYAVVNYDAWRVECNSENHTPDIPAKNLMKRLKNAKELGSYCRDNNLTSVVYLTCYSIPSKPLHFQLEPSFFTFLKDLSVLFVDFDFMT